MSETNEQKLAKVKTAAAAKWATGSAELRKLDKDVWHSIKADAGVKKTKWFQSGSSIGPKITKAQGAAEAFRKDMSLSNWVSATKTVEELGKECKGFWAKHKDAPKDQKVQDALDDYEKAATDALKALKEIAKSVEVLENMSRGDALARGTAGLPGT